VSIVNEQMLAGELRENDRFTEVITDDVVKILNVSKEVKMLFIEAPHGN
jgi:hypothetical protein